MPSGSASDDAITSGRLTSATNVTITISSDRTLLTLEGNQTLWDQAYLFEFMSAESTSANYLGTTSAFLNRGESAPAVLTLPTSTNFASVSFAQSVVGNPQDEDKGIAKIVVDLDTGLASGVINIDGGRGSWQSAYAFTGYNLSSDLPVLDPASGATIVGDSVANVTHLPNPTLLLGDNLLTVTRATTFGSNTNSLISVASYERLAVPSVATFLGNTSAFAALSPSNHLEGTNNTLVLTLPIPVSSQTATLTFAQSLFPNATNNENNGFGQLTVDLVAQTVSGELATVRTNDPDLVGIKGLPFGTTVDSGIGSTVTSNRANIGEFLDEYIGVLQFDVIGTAPSQSLQISATVPRFSVGLDHFWQADWFGDQPILFEGTASGTFSSGGINIESGLFFVDPADIASLSYTPNPDLAEGPINATITHGADIDPLQIFVRRVADEPTLVVQDQTIVQNVATNIANAIDAQLTDLDGSETLAIFVTLELGHRLSDGGANAFTAAAGSDTVDVAGWDLADLAYEFTTPGVYPVTVRVESTDSDNFTDNVADPTDLRADVTDTFDVTILVDTDGDGIADVDDSDGGLTPLLTNAVTPTLSGEIIVAPDETLSVTVNGVTYADGDGILVLNPDGTWELTIPANDALPDGDFTVTITVTDTDGNTTTDIATGVLSVDTTPPAVPTVTPQTTSSTTPTITGTATVAPDETLTVTVDGVTYVAGDGDLIDNGDGTWTLTVPTPLAEGVFDITATVTDAAGNFSSDASTDELHIDTTDPVVPTVITLTTNNASPVLSGTATLALGEVLNVTVDDVTFIAGDGNLVDNGDGTWDLSIPTVLNEGLFDITATVTDTADNVATDITTGELIIDLTAPFAPGVTSLATADTTPIIEGTFTAGDGETLTVTVNSVTYIAGDGNLVDNDDGTWTLVIPASDALPEMLYQVIATLSDTAGNFSTDSGIDELLVDSTAPNTPGVTSLTTNITAPTLQGTFSPAAGETLSVTVNAITYTQGDDNLVDNGDGTWTLAIPASDTLAEGLFDVSAVLTDSAGNFSTDPSSSELLIDTTAPVTPTVTPQTTSDTTPVITGTANAGPGETLTVTVDGVTYVAGDGDLVDNGDGTWTLTVPTPLAEGVFDITATVTDAAGNFSSDASTDELLIDTTAPGVPAVNALTTLEGTPIISGTAELAPGETLTVEVNGITYTQGDGNLTVNPDGTWELVIPASDALPAGNFPVTVSVTDAAGNSSQTVLPDALVVLPADDFDGDGIDGDGQPDCRRH